MRTAGIHGFVAGCGASGPRGSRSQADCLARRTVAASAARVGSAARSRTGGAWMGNRAAIVQRSPFVACSCWTARTWQAWVGAVAMRIGRG